MGIPGDDLFFSSMFCQLWQELRQHQQEKLRNSYTHPMDDGQSRAFKVKFDGEGVDDYGGPYREIFQQICDELQSADPSMKGGDADRPSSRPTDLDPSVSSEGVANNTAPVKCEEKYKYTFDSNSSSPVLTDMFRFIGQFIGIAIRSKVTVDFSFPSFIWKCLVRDPLTELDIYSIDHTSGWSLYFSCCSIQKWK